MRILDMVGARLDQLNEMAGQAGASFVSHDACRLEQDMRRAVFRCLFCRRAAECRTWLDADGAHGTAPEFCPNRDLFAQYRVADPNAQRRPIPAA